jgi:zinc protease
MTVIDWSAAELPSKVERLANGLTVIVHVEPKCPIAALYVGYRAGSRDEPASKAGLAHLCEHLMFSGTRRNPGSYFAPLEQAGASSMNAFVREDCSAYFATVPAARLDFAMMMEGDRMANIAEVLDDDKIERQRDVVVNELRQREGQPYGCSARILAELVHPSGHPYAHLPDGLIGELGNVSVDDVKAWFETRHSPAMATVVVAGDVEAERVIAQAESHFGSLAPKLQSPGRVAFTVDGSPLEPRRQIELPVQHDKLCIAWIGPGFASTEYPPLEAACEILAGAKSSRLWHRIVRAERLASDVAMELRPREFGVLIVLGVIARIGVSLSAIEKVVRDEIERLAAQGPEPHELNIARLRLFAKMVRGFERVGGPHSKSEALGLSAIVCGSSDSHRSRLLTMAAMQPDAVATASRWLKGAGAVLAMRPLSQRNGR